LDTKGPEIRTHDFVGGSAVIKDKSIVRVCMEKILGTAEKFSVTFPLLFDDLDIGKSIRLDDGKLELIVKEKDYENRELICEAQNTHKIKDKRGVNVPGVHVSMPFISEKDYNDIKFGCENGIDLIALSFVRRAEDVLEVKELLKKFGKPKIEIIAKIENQEGLDNIDEILNVANGVMVARGDLGVEVQAEMVPFYQKQIVSKANALGKPVIIATHMLESMIKNPRPTRAEASDVANAILDGCDAIMLSGESAVGKYPYESVEMMDRIARTAEKMFNYKNFLWKDTTFGFENQNDAIGICACGCAASLDNVVAIIAFTETGGTAKRICRFKPSVPLIACTDSIDTSRRLSYYRGVIPVSAKYIDNISLCDDIAIKAAKKFGFKKGSKIILTGGFGVEHGITNTIRIIEI
jgi:pyruvate kinase